MACLLKRLTATNLLLAALLMCAPSAAFIAPSDGFVDGVAAAKPARASFVVILRHGDAPGRGEPLSFDLNDCSTQRNLSDKGRVEARQLGAALRTSHIKIAKVLSSRWCRTRETAELLNVGPVEASAAFDNFEFNKHRTVALLDRERELIASWRGPGVLLIVTPSSNIKALTGLDVEYGAALVVSPDGDSNAALRFEKVALSDAGL